MFVFQLVIIRWFFSTVHLTDSTIHFIVGLKNSEFVLVVQCIACYSSIEIKMNESMQPVGYWDDM